MAEGTDKTEEVVKTDREEIFSRAVRAGKRTYFFDVKATRKNDYYLTLTESKKRFNRDGRFYFEKHKIFLYKEDFDKFLEGFEEAIEFIKNAMPEIIAGTRNTVAGNTGSDEFEADTSSLSEEENVDSSEDEAEMEEEEDNEESSATIVDNYTSDVKFEDLEDTSDRRSK
jgi:hypothetical protein